MRVCVDSNILLYAEGLNDEARRKAAREVLRRLDPRSVVLPLQVLGEVCYVLRTKFRFSAAAAAKAAEDWKQFASIHPETDDDTFSSAIHLVGAHGLQIWDAIILSAAAATKCHLLLSEDMQDGFVWRGVVVANPFAASPHPILVDLLRH